MYSVGLSEYLFLHRGTIISVTYNLSSCYSTVEKRIALKVLMVALLCNGFQISLQFHSRLMSFPRFQDFPYHLAYH